MGAICAHSGRKTTELALALLSVLWLVSAVAHAAERGSDHIWRAAGAGNVDEVRRFLDAEPGLADRLDQDGFAPLHRAACGGQVDTVTLLCKSGADPNIQQATFKGTPLQYAATYGHTRVIRVLVENKGRIDATDKFGRTPLMWAGMKGQTEAARLLLDLGANVDAQYRGGTALHLAVEHGHLDTAKLLIDQGADTAARNALGKTPAELNPAGFVLPDGSRADQNDPNYLERQQLQGSWKVVSWRVGGKAVEVESPSRFVFDESQVTVRVKTKSLKSHYALNARKVPKALTLSALSGQSKGPVNGIYSFHDNTLVLCLALRNEAPAPTEMETVEGDGRMLITLHRLPGPDSEVKGGQTDRNH